MSIKKRVKVAVSGAAGQIGYALIFRIASGQMFGPDTEVELNLLEVPPVLPSLEGVKMELDDCAFPLLAKVTTTDDVNVAMKDINWAVLVGSVPRKAGMERSELLGINGKIFTTQGRAINDHAASDARVFVVGNPCNTNCLIAMHNAPDVPRDRFYAMTMLDALRGRSQLAIKAERPVYAVKKLVVWGNHSSTQYPDFFNATIDGKLVTDVIHDLNWLENDFIPLIQQRGAAVIKARGASSAASAANAALQTVYHLVHDTEKDDWVSVARCSQGEYGIDEGLIFSVPCRVENGKLHVVKDVPQNDFGKKHIQITLDELRHEAQTVKEMGLIK